jgi:hypothetical protein
VFLADNGTNFQGRDNVLGEAKIAKKDLRDKRPIDLSEAQRKLNIEFRFAPPRAPHFQGLVERIVGAAKAALRPILRTALVSSEELCTIFANTTPYEATWTSITGRSLPITSSWGNRTQNCKQKTQPN